MSHKKAMKTTGSLIEPSSVGAVFITNGPTMIITEVHQFNLCMVFLAIHKVKGQDALAS